MRDFDMQKIIEQIKGLADLYGMREPSDRALRLWIDTLEPINPVHTLRALREWPSRHPKMPTPADLFKIAMGYQSDRMEQLAAEEKAKYSEGAEMLNRYRGCSPACKRALERWFSRFERMPKVPENHWIDLCIYQYATGRTRDAQGVWIEQKINPVQIAALARVGIYVPISQGRIDLAIQRVNQIERERHIPTLAEMIAEEKRLGGEA